MVVNNISGQTCCFGLLSREPCFLFHFHIIFKGVFVFCFFYTQFDASACSPSRGGELQELTGGGPRLAAGPARLRPTFSPQSGSLRTTLLFPDCCKELVRANTSRKAQSSLAAQQTDTISKTERSGVNSAAVASKREESENTTADERPRCRTSECGMTCSYSCGW